MDMFTLGFQIACSTKDVLYEYKQDKTLRSFVWRAYIYPIRDMMS